MKLKYCITDPSREESIDHRWIPFIKGQWCGTLIFRLMSVCANNRGWINMSGWSFDGAVILVRDGYVIVSSQGNAFRVDSALCGNPRTLKTPLAKRWYCGAWCPPEPTIQKQSSCRWFETHWLMWCHCNAFPESWYKFVTIPFSCCRDWNPLERRAPKRHHRHLKILPGTGTIILYPVSYRTHQYWLLLIIYYNITTAYDLISELVQLHTRQSCRYGNPHTKWKSK